MSEATVTYNGSEIASIEGGESVILATIGKYLTSNITIEAAESSQVEVVQAEIVDGYGMFSNVYYINQYGEFTVGSFEADESLSEVVWRDDLCSGSMVMAVAMTNSFDTTGMIHNLEQLNVISLGGRPTSYVYMFKVTGQGAPAGNGRYEVGDITIPSEVLVTATPEPFPGLELDFDPDYIQVWFDKDDFNDITSVQNGRMYLIVGIKHDSNFIPVRPSAGRPYIADELSTNGYYFLAGTNMIAASSPDTGYGLAGWAGSIWATAYPGWEIDDGKFYIRRLAAGNQKIPPGTYHYVAYKRGV